MSTVNSTVLADLGLAQKTTTAKKSQTLGQDDFLKLMTTQLKYQDPMKPLDNAQFVSQMAQFSTVSGIQALQTSFTQFASSLQSSQSLQAATLVGRNVLVPATEGHLASGGALLGAAEVSTSGDVSVAIKDASGATVRHLDLGTQQAGLASFAWDGTSDSGAALPAGLYQISAASGGSGAQQALTTYAVGHVDGVALGSGGLMLDLTGMSGVAFRDVRQIL